MDLSGVTIGRSPLRAIVEAAVYLLLAALFVETWLLGGVAAPTRLHGGSMAETLLGRHRRLACADCGYCFNRGAERLFGRKGAVCPNCGFAENDIGSAKELDGGRVFIDRRAFSLRRPRRWEAAALRHPLRADEIAVKRIVGLPGESIEIRGGDVYADGRIRRKNLARQRAMGVPVYDASFPPTRPPVPPPRWRSEGPSSGWRSDRGIFTHPPRPGNGAKKGTVPGRIDWLVYHHRRRGPKGFQDSPVVDLHGYNQSRPRREEDVHAVADLMLSFYLTPRSQRGTFHLRIGDGRERFVALLRFERGGLRYEVRHDGRPIAGASGEAAEGKGRRLIEAALIDRRFLLAIDGVTLVRRATKWDRPPSAGTSTPLAIGAQGLAVTLEDMRIFRDVYYTRPAGGKSSGLIRLGGNEYYVLGDNSPVSEDSRHWPNGGAVAGDLLLGKPVWFSFP